MADQDGLRFLFDINDKITAKLAKITSNVLASEKKIDKALTRSSKSQQTNSARTAAAKQRHIQVVGKAHARALADLKRQSERAAAAEKRRINTVNKAHISAIALIKRESAARDRAAARAEKAAAAVRRRVQIVMAAMGVAIAAGIKSFAALAFETVESQALVSESFGTMTADAKAWAAKLSDSFGLNRFEMERMSAVLFTMTESMGLSSDAAFDLSTGAVELAADMASFYNLSHEDVLDKIKSGLTGEAEPLKRLGILVNENTIKQVAYNAGIAERGAVLTEVQKVEARWLAITQQTTKAQGDLARTLESPTNKLRRMKSELAEAATKLSQALLPALSTGVGLLTKFASALSGGIGWLAKSKSPLEKLTDGYDDLTEKIADATEMLEWEQKTYGYRTRTSAKVLRSLVAERRELDRHIKQRASWTKMTEEMAKVREQAERDSAKAAEAAAEAAAELAEAEREAKRAAEDSAKAVKALADSWTGATLKSGKFLRAFRRLTPEQKKNDRIMRQVLTKYDSMRKILGPFNKELEAQWRATRRLNPELAAFHREQEKAEKAAEALNDRLEDQRRRLLKLPTDEAIREFDELTRTWEGLNDEVKKGYVLERYTKIVQEAAEAGHKLDDAQLAIIESTKTAKQETSGYDLALAAVAGKMGGATGQALNLVIAMREHNKVQRQAALAGQKTEAQFGKMRIGAATVSAAFSAIGGAIGGTAGKVISELSSIASAFATGGVAGGIIAGAVSLAKKIFGIFSKGKKKRKAAAAAALAERQRLAEEEKSYWDSVYSSMVSGYDRAKAAGIAAYDKIYEASVKSGIGQELAIALATQAQLEASDKILIAEGEKFVRMAAFEAALKAIRAGNTAGAAAAAVKAAADTRTAWLTALTAVEDADKITTAAMIKSSSKLTSSVIADARRARVAQVAAANVARERWGNLRDRRQHLGAFGGNRQHGGPVRAGRPYLVGERGPEMFVPSQSGRIDPNGSSGSGSGVDAKALGRAVADALEGTRVEVDGRKLGRLTVRHQPLAMAELGGRR